MKKISVALLCGGPSLERGISLNSARSVCDHLQSNEIDVLPIYFDHHKTPYQISRDQLYSNTPSDFDFKLKQTATALSEKKLLKLLKSTHIVFPVMHGSFGEDGQIQSFLEKNNIPYVGSPKNACYTCFDKHRSNEFLKQQGFYTLPNTVLKIHKHQENAAIIKDFFKKHKLTRAIIKPATGGSSIGVYSVNSISEAIEATKTIFNKRIDTRVVLEPFCPGIEFTVIILQNRFGMPVAMFPTEIEMAYEKNQIFDYRRKYLATNQRAYHCPPRFPDSVTEKIQVQAEQLFTALGMKDFARFDGWLMPDGNVWFSDFNPISGMEQNSFLFLQAAQVGFSHKDLLFYILKNSCLRQNIPQPLKDQTNTTKRQPIPVIFGGSTSERQVSVMSGTNVWLKLRKSQKYQPIPYLLDTDDKTLWHLPYSKTLNHTTEEIKKSCLEAKKLESWIAPLRQRVLLKLAAEPGHLNEELFIPRKLSLKQFCERYPQVFLGLHGGVGENGVLQKYFENKNLKFNGSDSKASALCADKYLTGQALDHLSDQGIYHPKKILLSTKSLFHNPAKLYKQIIQHIGSKNIIVKPPQDGCSTGIVRIHNLSDLKAYLKILKNAQPQIPANTLKDQPTIIEMPTEPPENLMFEQFITTDKISIVQQQIKWKVVTNWVEITMGLLGKKDQMKALNPSITVANSTILSLEEKFQGGTGVNITPPPQPYVKQSATKKAKQRMEIVAKTLGLHGYARIDAFMHTQTGEIIIIEANTTPALTASTVIFHQALAETPKLYPTQFLEEIIDLS